MHFRLNKYLIEQNTRFLRRLFKYNNEWTNKDIEIIQVSSGSSLSIFEQFFYEEEKYPVISIGTSGGNYSQNGFNDLWRVVDDDKIILGNRSLTREVISDVNELYILLPSDVTGETIRGIDINLAWTGNDVGGDDINVNIYRDFTTSPVLLGSGSLQGNTKTELSTYFCGFSNNIFLDGEDFAITLNTQPTSSYYVCIDNSEGNYIYNQNGISIYKSGSIAGNLYLPAFVRFGGIFQSTLNFKVQAKNSTAQVYNLIELMSMYYTLAKHGQISRTSTAINGMKWSDSDVSLISSELTEKGIYVKAIKQGGLETRRRGEKDIIFGMTLSIDFVTEWFEDYTIDTLKNIEIEANSFLENLIN